LAEITEVSQQPTSYAGTLPDHQRVFSSVGATLRGLRLAVHELSRGRAHVLISERTVLAALSGDTC